VDGKTNTVKALGPEISGNWIQNATDYTVFNGNPYAVNMSINSFTWGSDDKVYLHDASATTTFTEPIWSTPIGTYGGKDNGGQNANGTGDVILKIFQTTAIICISTSCSPMDVLSVCNTTVLICKMRFRETV
jgi:hypothetical protein